MAQPAQEPPKSHIVISTQRFNENIEDLRKEIDISKILALQLMVDRIEQVWPMIESTLATQQQLIARISTLEQQIKDKAEQKKQVFSERKTLGPQPIPQALKKTDCKQVRFAQENRIIGEKTNPKRSVGRNQSTVSFKLVATGLITALAWWLWIYTHQK
jgi:uncharacterized protein (UPF0335 family)